MRGLLNIIFICNWLPFYDSLTKGNKGSNFGKGSIKRGGLISLFIICLIGQVFSKDATIDSLKQVLINLESDSIKYKVSRKIGDAYYESDIDSLLLYADF